MALSNEIANALWEGSLSICAFVSMGEIIWVVDEKFNFSLDAEKDYRAYLEKGYINESQYLAACKEFRGGVLRLNQDNFYKYLGNSSTRVVPKEELEGFFFGSIDSKDALLDEVEIYYISGRKISEKTSREAHLISSKLPAFYVNFDRKIFMHLDEARAHEDLAYDDWYAKNGDFSFLIPDSQRYWVKAGRDYWKMRRLYFC